MTNKLNYAITRISRDVTLTPRESALCLAACAFGAIACTMTGVVIGILLSPPKTITIGSHNGCNNGSCRTPEAGDESTDPIS